MKQTTQTTNLLNPVFWLVLCSLFVLLTACQVAGQPLGTLAEDSDQIVNRFALAEAPVIAPTATLEKPTYKGEQLQVEHIDPLELSSSEIFVSGSTTVHAITANVAENFNDDGFAGRFHLSQSSSSAALTEFCAGGEIDIVNSDRSLTSLVVNRCRDVGREPVIFHIGYDRLVYIAHEDNFWIDSLETDDLKALFTAEQWSDFDPFYPDRPLNQHFPDFRQNSMKRMITEVYGNAVQPDLGELPNVRFYKDESELATAVAADVNGIGFVSFGTLATMSQVGLKVIPLDDSDHLTDINYPVQRSLYLITDEETLSQKPQVTAFIAYYLNRAHLEMPPLGFSPLTLRSANQERSKFVNTVQSIEMINAQSNVALISKDE